MKTHGMAPAVPAVEVADDAHTPCARRPHREGDTAHAVDHGRVCAQLVVSTVVSTLRQEMTVEVAQKRGKAVRVFDLCDVAVPRHLEPVGERDALVGQYRF